MSWVPVKRTVPFSLVSWPISVGSVPLRELLHICIYEDMADICPISDGSVPLRELLSKVQKACEKTVSFPISVGSPPVKEL